MRRRRLACPCAGRQVLRCRLLMRWWRGWPCLGGSGRACARGLGIGLLLCWLGRGRLCGGSVCWTRWDVGSWVIDTGRWTYFSLSINEGQRAGRIFAAASSSLKVSAVAARARRPAFRAWTNGSRKDRVKAAMRTLDRVCDITVSMLSSRSLMRPSHSQLCSSF